MDKAFAEWREQTLPRVQKHNKWIEADFARRLRSAQVQFPKDAKSPLFSFVVRKVWEGIENADDFRPQEFRRTYLAFREEHRWLLEDSTAKGRIPDESLRAIARVLVVLRRRQRIRMGK